MPRCYNEMSQPESPAWLEPQEAGPVILKGKTKRCGSCKQELQLEEFYRHRGKHDGRQTVCKECQKQQGRERHAANPQPFRQQVRRWRVANRERSRQLDRDRRARAPEPLRQQARDWRARNPNKVREDNSRRKRENREKVAAHCALYYAVKTGRITPEPCRLCGRSAEAHHPDYGRPLDVAWLCRTHHLRLHAKLFSLLPGAP